MHRYTKEGDFRWMAGKPDRGDEGSDRKRGDTPRDYEEKRDNRKSTTGAPPVWPRARRHGDSTTDDDRHDRHRRVMDYGDSDDAEYSGGDYDARAQSHAGTEHDVARRGRDDGSGRRHHHDLGERGWEEEEDYRRRQEGKGSSETQARGGRGVRGGEGTYRGEHVRQQYSSSGGIPPPPSSEIHIHNHYADQPDGRRSVGGAPPVAYPTSHHHNQSHHPRRQPHDGHYDAHKSPRRRDRNHNPSYGGEPRLVNGVYVYDDEHQEHQGYAEDDEYLSSPWASDDYAQAGGLYKSNSVYA